MARSGSTGLDQNVARGHTDVYELEEKGDSVFHSSHPQRIAEPKISGRFAAVHREWCVAEK